MIKAPRRFGKTSLVKHLLENKKEYHYVYIDINLVSNLKSLADKIIPNFAIDFIALSLIIEVIDF